MQEDIVKKCIEEAHQKSYDPIKCTLPRGQGSGYAKDAFEAIDAYFKQNADAESYSKVRSIVKTHAWIHNNLSKLFPVGT